MEKIMISSGRRAGKTWMFNELIKAGYKVRVATLYGTADVYQKNGVSIYEPVKGSK